MMRILILIIPALLAISTCSQKEPNPFFSDYDTPFGVPPFNQIKIEHYFPAFKEGIRKQQEEVNLIVNNKEIPNFKNTIEALEVSGMFLQKVEDVFYNMTSAHTNDELQQIAKDISPLLSKNSDDIRLNEGLFQRIKSIYQQKDLLSLTTEQNKLLEETYKYFIRGGANLNNTQKEALRQINSDLALLTLKFGDNVLLENNRFEMVIDNVEDLAGLPENVISAATQTANERGHQGKWVFTLHKPSLIPFLQYSEKRQLREKMLKAYITRGDHGDDYDNKDILTNIVALRIKKANLLGYKTHADFVLEETMAKNPLNVFELLNKLWKPALTVAKKEASELQDLIYREGKNFKLEPWDWWYYTEKLKKEKYDLDEEEIRPYFQLENVRDGAFEIAHKLYGITFTEQKNLPVYHPDVAVFQVKEANGDHIGLLYTDYFPRTSKRGGAWMNAFRKQYRMNGKKISPIIVNVGNLSRPTKDKPALLSWDEVNTLFHEFGHALHGLLSDRNYHSLTGTSVPRDFVELPSQIMENWAVEPEVLKNYARHYRTGEAIPDELIEKIQQTRLFNQGFITLEYLAAAFLDMFWHTLSNAEELNPAEFEIKALKDIDLIPEIVVRYRSPYFQHIFSGGYSSGYYSYIWAEVLDADAFQAFKENGIFDGKTATLFRENILATGGTEDPMILFKRFRGAEPKIDALLAKRGLR